MKTKKLVCLILAAALLFAFAACKRRNIPADAATTATDTTEANTTEIVTTQEQTQTDFSEPTTTAKPDLTETTKRPKPPTTAAPATTTEVVTEAVTENPSEPEFTLLGSFLLDSEEISSVSKDIAKKSEVYLVTLSDGSKTYYMAVDLQTAEALSLANPAVLRGVCRELDSKQQKMPGASSWARLMSYEHLVGELEMHRLAYLATSALGGESGLFARFYNSAKVADLNIDENRGAAIIKILGTIYS